MTTFAQKDFDSKIGNSELTIAQAGSLLTAISNLLSRFSFSVDPESLANYLQDMEVDPTKLTWGHISLVHPEVGIYAIGNGVPQYNDSIVVFNHNGRISYAVVADAVNGTIIDSFDGEEKSWELYGSPKMFVTFVKYQPLEVTPLILTAPVTESPVSDTTTETSIATDTPEAETFDLTKDEEIDTTSGIFAESNTVTPVKQLSKTPEWKMTLKTGLGVIEGIAKEDAIITDLDGEQPDQKLPAGTLVYIAGRFVKDGTPYYRTVGSTNNDHWYGIPAGVLGKTEKQEEDDFDHLLEEITMDVDEDDDLTKREKLIKSAATVEGKLLNVFKRNKKTKEIE